MKGVFCPANYKPFIYYGGINTSILAFASRLVK